MTASNFSSPSVVWLDAPGTVPSDTLKWGGKGRLLACLASAGLPVPLGFILTAVLFPPAPPVGVSVEQVPPLPAAAAEALATAYADLGRRLRQPDPLVAVRSSGVAEDLAAASFAGQYLTILGVRGLPEVQAAVARCWASLWSPEVAAYRAAVERKIGQTLPPPGMAVIVQALVQAEAAGVAETLDTISQENAILTIRAAWGLGRSVVDGSVQPDTWRIARSSLVVLELKTGDKATQAGLGLDAQPQPVPEALRRQPCLTLDQAAQVAALALQAEKVINGPADVEWALQDGNIWLLQARPLTDLGQMTEQPVKPQIEALPGPIGPSDAFPFTWPNAADASIHWRREAGDARVFEALLPFELDARAINVRSCVAASWLRGVPEVDRCLEVNGYLYNARVPSSASAAERALLSELYLWRVRPLHERGETLFEHVILPEVRAGMQRRTAINPDTLATPDLAAHFEDVLHWYERVWSLHMAMDDWDDFSPVGRCMKLYRDLTGETNGWEIFKPFEYAPQKEHEAVIGLIELARLIKASPTLRPLFETRSPAEILSTIDALQDGQTFLQKLDALLAVHGFQSGASQGVMGPQVMPGWREEPALAIAILQRYLPQDLDGLLETSQRSLAHYRPKIAELRQRVVAAGATPEQVAEFDFWFAAVERMVISIVDHNFYIDAPMNALMHWALMASGRRLALAGAIDEADDIWYFRAHQVAPALRSLDDPHRPDWRALVAAQKALLDWQRSLTPPAYLGAPPPAPPQPPASAHGDPEELPPNLILKGWAAVPGRVTGRVRRINYHDLVPELAPGDIFVAEDCGVLWASLLPIAGAVILEGSNPGEHAMRICREFGVPGVVQAKGATALLREGQRVTVDGAKGWVLAA